MAKTRNPQIPQENRSPETGMPGRGSSAWRWFLLLWVLSAALRVVYVVDIMDAPDISSPILDSNWHRTQAMRIVGGEWLPEAPLWRAPAYPYFLAPLFFLSKGDPTLARLVQAVLAGAVCGLIYLVGRRVFGHTVGVVAGFLAAGYQMFIYFSSELLAVTLEVFVNVLLLLMVLRAEERPTWRSWFVAGCFLGLSAVVRPNVLVFAVFLFLAVKGLRSLRTNWGRALSLVAGTLVLILPVTAVNLVKGKDTVLIAYQGGVNFYIGNSPFADGKTVLVPGMFEQEYSHSLGEYRCQVQMVSEVMAERECGREMKPSERDRFWYGKAFRTILDDPGQFGSLLFRKLYYFWNAYEVSNNRDIERFVRDHSPWLRGPLPWFGLVAPLGIIGMAASWRRGRRERLLWLFFLAQMVSVILFFVCARYRLSAVSVLIIFAAYGATWLVGGARKRNWNRLGVGLPLLALLLWFVHTDYFDVRKVTDESIHHFNQAMALGREGRFEEAAALIQIVGQMNPRDPMVHCALGSTLLQAGRYDEARAAYDRALAVRPSLGAIIHSDLGTYLASQGRNEEAEAEFRAALRSDPGFIHARLNLAGLLSNSGRPEEALPEFEEVLRRAPAGEAGRVLTEIAVTLNRLGRRQEAIETVRTCIARDRTNARAHALLAGYLEAEGDLEGARKEWELAREWAQSDRQRLEAEEHLDALR